MWILWDLSHIFFNWRIIALQCCGGFCCITTWISYKYIYIPPLLSLPTHYLSPVVASRGSSNCSAQASLCGGSSCCRAWAQWLWLLDSRAQASLRGSAVVTHELCCPTACGIVLDQGVTRISCTGRFCTTDPPEKPWIKHFKIGSFPIMHKFTCV